MSVYRINHIEELLGCNTYPGRGIAVGLTPDSEYAAAAYFIMGRSENSRNRIFTESDGEIIIHPYDPSKVSDPSLIIYSPVRMCEKKLIVTNGNQTDTICDFLKKGGSFEEALETRCFEPDSPNYTPRISALLDFEDKYTYKLSILKSADESGSACSRYTFSYDPIPGLGHLIHTYNSDGNPIPAFTGEPKRIEIPVGIDEFTAVIWNSLDSDNKISLFVRYTSLRTGKSEDRMINKNK